jgi:hypothetical protein
MPIRYTSPEDAVLSTGAPNPVGGTASPAIPWHTEHCECAPRNEESVFEYPVRLASRWLVPTLGGYPWQPVHPVARAPFQFGVVAPRWQPVAGLKVPQLPKLPPLTATAWLFVRLYVKPLVPGSVIDPFVCVFTVAAAWQLAQLGVPLCFGCACVVSVVELVPWHSVQLLVPPPSTVFQV